MKAVKLLAVAALIAGGIYHAEVSRFIAGLNSGHSQSGGGPSVVNSIQGTGNAGNALMGGVGNSLNR